MGRLVRPGKYLIGLGLLFLLLWGYSAFWPITQAEIIDVKRISFNQAGYAEGIYAPSYKGGSMTFLIAKYSYEVDGKAYIGKGFSKIEKLNNGKFNSIKVHYFNLFPAFSFSFRGGLILIGFVIIFIGYGVMQMRLFVEKWLKQKHP